MSSLIKTLQLVLDPAKGDAIELQFAKGQIKTGLIRLRKTIAVNCLCF